MTPEQREDFEERCAIVEEGNPGMTRAQQTHGSRVYTPGASRVVGAKVWMPIPPLSLTPEAT